jgi:hypothetical protein
VCRGLSVFREDALMARKPTYRELEQRLKDLEREALERRRAEEGLRENKEGYRESADLLPQRIFEESIGLRGFVIDLYDRKRVKKLYLFVTLFLVLSLSYLLLLFLFPRSSLAQGANIFHSVWANVIVLVISFLFIAFGLSELIDLVYRRILRMRWRKIKLGDILVSEGYITEKELDQALSEQKLKLGEVLFQSGRITRQQLNQALDHQKRLSRRLGEVLKELGHSRDEDINWALDRMDRRLGEILKEKRLVTDHELHRVLALQHYGPP